MYATSAWKSPSKARRTEPRTVRFDLRDRVKEYTNDGGIANSPSPDDLSPTDAFFAAPSTSAVQNAARQSPIRRPQKIRHIQREPKKQQVRQEKRLSLSDLQATQSPLAKELIDRVVSKSDSIYGDALTRLGDLHKELANIIAETSAEDDRILKLLETNHEKIIKPPSESRILDERITGGEIHVGERVAFVKDRVDTVEAEVASLWDQWENAQKEVDDIFAELASAQGVGGLQTGSVASVQDSLAGEMAKFREELTGLLEDAHEEARASEKHYAKAINGVMSALLQQYLLED